MDRRRFIAVFGQGTAIAVVAPGTCFQASPSSPPPPPPPPIDAGAEAPPDAAAATVEDPQPSGDDMPLLGEIMMFAGNYAPKGWAFCNGQLMPISDNAALFSILGTTYGGDGRTTFALPDLRGRVPLHPNSDRPLGSQGGRSDIPAGTAAAGEGATVAAPADNSQPYLSVHFIIATAGTFPTRG